MMVGVVSVGILFSKPLAEASVYSIVLRNYDGILNRVSLNV